MEIKQINKKETWEAFLSGCDEKTFLQSFNWGEFQKMLGNKIWRLGVYQKQELVSAFLIIKIKAKRGTFLFLPHGPTIRSNLKSQKSKILTILLEELKKTAKEKKVGFIRIAPIWKRDEENIEIFKDLGFRLAPIHMHPEVTWELNLNPTEEQLLMGMRKTTRYLIRQAQKNKDIEIIQSQKLEDLEIFNKLYQETVRRHHFIPFSLDYLKNEIDSFSLDNQISIFLAKYKNEIVSSGVFIFWSNRGFYHHGASSLKYPKIPASYLLQWEAIKEAKRRGCKVFNFWGITPKITNKKHPWAGLSLFKKGFGGERKEYVKTQDFPFSKVYWLTFLFEKIRKEKRGL